MPVTEVLSAVLSIADAAEAADGAAPLDEATILTLRHRPDSVRSWVEEDGFALLIGSELSLVVRPDARGRGAGTRLLDAVLGDAVEPLTAWSHGNQPAAAALAASHGFRAARELWVMRRPAGDLPPLPAPTDGVELRGFRTGDEQELLRVNASAFAHHPEQGHMTSEDFRERMTEAWFDPEGLFLAVPDDEGALTGDPSVELLGFHWTKVHRDEDPPYGEVYVVATNPKAAGRGLGTLLTKVGLEHLATQGVDEVILYVDGDNDPAIAVYEGQGFGSVRTEVQYRGATR